MTKWINTQDRFPNEYIFVLVYEFRSKDEPCPISIARWEGDCWNGLGENCDETNSYWSDLFTAIDWSKITHWMPLPQPPEEQE